MMGLGWDHSAPGWLASMGETGDVTRVHVMDAPMLAALPAQGDVLDIGCGEGRFCRMMQARGLRVVGLDPTAALLDAARARDATGSYIQGGAENLPFEPNSFDAVVFYLSLIDIPDFRAAICEAVRVMRPGGRMVIANLTPHVTARPRNWRGEGNHWVVQGGERQHLAVDDMNRERAITSAWGGIRIENHHRPLSAYMTSLLDAGLILRQFEDPPCTGPDTDTIDRYTRMPWAFLMVWDKPEET